MLRSGNFMVDAENDERAEELVIARQEERERQMDNRRDDALAERISAHLKGAIFGIANLQKGGM